MTQDQRSPYDSWLFEQAGDIESDLIGHLSPAARFYLDHGRPFGPASLTESEIAVLKQVKSMDMAYFKQGQCYRNSMLIAAKVPDLAYTEGLAISPFGGMLCRHAWLTLNDKPIDVTWPFGRDDRPTRNLDRMLKRIEHNLHHARYWGVVIPMKIVSKHIVAVRRFSPLGETVGLDLGPLLKPIFARRSIWPKK